MIEFRGENLKKILIVGYYHSKHDKRVFRTVKALSKKSLPAGY